MSFRSRAYSALALPILASLLITVCALVTLQFVIESAEEFSHARAESLVYVEKLRGSLEWKVASNRGFFLTKDTLFLDRETAAREEFAASLARLKSGVKSDEGRKLIREIELREIDHQKSVEEAKEERMAADIKMAIKTFENEVFPKREKLRLAIAALEARKWKQFIEGKERMNRARRLSVWLIMGVAAFSLLLTGYLAFTLTRRMEKAFELEFVSRKNAEAAATARGEFLTVASHELRTPLTSLYAQLQMMDRLAQKPISDADYRREVAAKSQSALRQSKRLSALIDTLLDTTGLTGQEIALQKEEFDFVSLVRTHIDELQHEERNSGCVINFQGPKELRLSADPLRVGQAVVNLVGNAIKYGEGRPIEVTLVGSADAAILSVKDYGMGVAEADQEKIFDRFERAVSARPMSGLGLGLYITRQIAAAHRGTLTVESTLGAGSLFTLTLPKSGMPA